MTNPWKLTAFACVATGAMLASGQASAAPTKVAVPLGSSPVTVVGTPMKDAGEDTSKLGFNACAGAFSRVSTAATLTFDLAGPVAKDAEVRLIAGAGVLILPSGSYVCVQEGQAIGTNLVNAAGTYSFRSWQDSRGAPKLMLADPKAIRSAALAQFKPVSFDFAANPIQTAVEVPATAPITMTQAGIEKCASEKWAVPVAELQIADTSNYIMAADGSYVLQASDGACVKGIGGFKSKELKAGGYRVWRTATTPETLVRGKMRFAIRDTERPLSWPGVETIDLTKRRAKHRDFGFAYSEAGLNVIGFDCAGIGLSPVALLKVKSAKVNYGEVWGPGGAPLVIGPLESSSSGPLKCESGLGESPKGTYAVFQKTEDSLKGAPGIFTVGAKPKSLLKLTTEVDAETPLQARSVSRYFAHYFNQEGPLYSGVSKEPLKADVPVDAVFAKAPKNLFVYALAQKAGLAVGEPLLLASFGEEKSTVYRLNGTTAEVRTTALTTDKPEKLALPAKVEKLSVPSDLKAGLSLAGPLQSKTLAKLNKAFLKYEKCYLKYRKKKDAAFTDDFDLVKARGAEDASDKTHKRAQKKCKWKKLLKKEKSAVKAIVKARNKEKAKALRAVKKLAKK